MEENGDGRVGRRGVGTLLGGAGRGRALSRSRETTVELHSDSEYADSISGQGKKVARQPGKKKKRER